jgi:hypothetical protein
MDGFVTEWEPPRLMTFSLTTTPGQGTLRQTLEPIGQTTRVARIIELDLRPPFSVIWPVVGAMTRRRWDRSTRKLKQLIEAAGAIEPAAEVGRAQD